MILKEFSDYIKSREALAEAFSESAEGATGTAGLADPTTDANATDPATATTTPTITDSASAEISANDIQNIKKPKTEESREAEATEVFREAKPPQNSKFSCVKLLNEWLVKKLRSVPISNVDKIICNELFLATNKKGETLIIAKRESGRKLLRALYNFSLSYEHYRFARRTHEVRPSNFTNRKD